MKTPPPPRSTLIHITVMGEMTCQGEGCPYCADDHRFIAGVMAFALQELGIGDGRLAEELATKWEERRDG